MKKSFFKSCKNFEYHGREHPPLPFCCSIKVLLKRMQHSALKRHFSFLCLASGKGLCTSSLKTLSSVKVCIVLTDVTFSEPNKMGSNLA